MATPTTGRRRRSYRILRLFFSLVLSFLVQYLRARLSGHSYDFFADSRHNRRRAIKIRSNALEMGGVLIKLGQFLSSRVDLLPIEYIEELALLQDEVPGVPFRDIRATVQEELGTQLEELFSSFDAEPIAAASLGQVHEATLKTGERVAVKVRRPHIAEIVEADLASLQYIVTWLNRFSPVRKRVNLPLIFREFEDTLRMELDYIAEGHHAERLAIAFRDWTDVSIPRIYWSHSTGRVLTMQYMWGIKVTDFAGLERAGISRSLVADILMRAYLKQVLEDGFFHADPHPGNIFIRPGPVVVFLDHGMVGELSPQTGSNIRRVFLGVVRRDFDDVVLALQKLGFFTRDVDILAVKRSLVWAVDTFYEMSLGQLQTVNPFDVLDQVQDILYSESFQIPANFAFLGRALGTLSGLCTALDPSFQFVSVAEPYARGLLRGPAGFRGVVAQIASEARSLAATAYSLPYLSRHALQRMQEEEIGVRHELSELSRAGERVERAVRRILYAMLLTGFLLTGALVFPTRYGAWSLVAFAIAFVLLVYLVVSIGRRK